MTFGATEDDSGLVLTQREPVKVGWPLLKWAVEQDLTGVYQNRGFALYAAKCFDKAITEFSESIRLFGVWHTYYERGRAYFHSGRFNEALDDFRRAINLSPENPDLEGFPAGAHYFLGCCYLENSEFANAISELTTSIQLAPHAYCSYEDRAKAYRALRDEAHAREDDNRARELREQGRGSPGDLPQNPGEQLHGTAREDRRVFVGRAISAQHRSANP
jgi:tetratricopeptide (TPR) repeat protein